MRDVNGAVSIGNPPDGAVRLAVLEPPVVPDAAELADLSRTFEHQVAGRGPVEGSLAVIEWAVESFGPFLALTASMTDAVLIDLAVRVEPSIEVVFIDTGFHFPETLETAERVRRQYGLNLRTMTVARHNGQLWRDDPEGCCSAVKVGQLDRALAGKVAWMSGLRRAEADTRAGAPIVGHDLRGLVKVNPIAAWSNVDVSRYIAERNLVVNPLVAQGFRSIGCMPCTRPVDDGEDDRAGRWSAMAKTECGLHL